jgi:hypothetical protein
MDWATAAEIALPICKVGGVVGAFLGLSEAIRSNEPRTGLKRFGPTLLLLLAVSAEVIDADIKHRQDVHSKQQETATALIDEELLRPIHKVTAFYTLWFPASKLSVADPTYYKRLILTKDVTEADAGVEHDRRDSVFPRDKKSPTYQALTFYYAASLQIISNPSKAQGSTQELFLMLSPGAEYRPGWGHMEATFDPKHPLDSRRYLFSTNGIKMMDPPVTQDPESIMFERHLKSASQLAGKTLKLVVCPHSPNSKDWADDAHAKQLSEMLTVSDLWLELEGVGGIGGPEVIKSLKKSVRDNGCAMYDFPSESPKLNDMIQ